MRTRGRVWWSLLVGVGLWTARSGAQHPRQGGTLRIALPEGPAPGVQAYWDPQKGACDTTR
jgi:hypothetical protein